MFYSSVGNFSWKRDRLPTLVFLGFPGGLASKQSVCNEGDLGSIPRLGRSPWRREKLPTPVFRPGEFYGLYSPWGRKESDTTERLSLSLLRADPSAKPGSLSAAGLQRLCECLYIHVPFRQGCPRAV